MIYYHKIFDLFTCFIYLGSHKNFLGETGSRVEKVKEVLTQRTVPNGRLFPSFLIEIHVFSTCKRAIAIIFSGLFSKGSFRLSALKAG